MRLRAVKDGLKVQANDWAFRFTGKWYIYDIRYTGTHYIM